jgi:hypothetical protein
MNYESKHSIQLQTTIEHHPIFDTFTTGTDALVTSFNTKIKAFRFQFRNIRNIRLFV